MTPREWEPERVPASEFFDYDPERVILIPFRDDLNAYGSRTICVRLMPLGSATAAPELDLANVQITPADFLQCTGFRRVDGQILFDAALARQQLDRPDFEREVAGKEKELEIRAVEKAAPAGRAARWLRGKFVVKVEKVDKKLRIAWTSHPTNDATNITRSTDIEGLESIIELDPDGQSGFALWVELQRWNEKDKRWDPAKDEVAFTHWLARGDRGIDLGVVSPERLPWDRWDADRLDPQADTAWRSVVALPDEQFPHLAPLPFDTTLSVKAWRKQDIIRRANDIPEHVQWADGARALARTIITVRFLRKTELAITFDPRTGSVYGDHTFTTDKELVGDGKDTVKFRAYVKRSGSEPEEIDERGAPEVELNTPWRDLFELLVEPATNGVVRGTVRTTKPIVRPSAPAPTPLPTPTPTPSPTPTPIPSPTPTPEPSPTATAPPPSSAGPTPTPSPETTPSREAPQPAVTVCVKSSAAAPYQNPLEVPLLVVPISAPRIWYPFIDEKEPARRAYIIDSARSDKTACPIELRGQNSATGEYDRRLNEAVGVTVVKNPEGVLDEDLSPIGVGQFHLRTKRLVVGKEPQDAGAVVATRDPANSPAAENQGVELPVFYEPHAVEVKFEVWPDGDEQQKLDAGTKIVRAEQVRVLCPRLPRWFRGTLRWEVTKAPDRWFADPGFRRGAQAVDLRSLPRTGAQRCLGAEITLHEHPLPATEELELEIAVTSHDFTILVTKVGWDEVAVEIAEDSTEYAEVYDALNRNAATVSFDVRGHYKSPLERARIDDEEVRYPLIAIRRDDGRVIYASKPDDEVPTVTVVIGKGGDTQWVTATLRPKRTTVETLERIESLLERLLIPKTLQSESASALGLPAQLRAQFDRYQQGFLKDYRELTNLALADLDAPQEAMGSTAEPAVLSALGLSDSNSRRQVAAWQLLMYCQNVELACGVHAEIKTLRDDGAAACTHNLFAFLLDVVSFGMAWCGKVKSLLNETKEHIEKLAARGVALRAEKARVERDITQLRSALGAGDSAEIVATLRRRAAELEDKLASLTRSESRLAGEIGELDVRIRALESTPADALSPVERKSLADLRARRQRTATSHDRAVQDLSGVAAQHRDAAMKAEQAHTLQLKERHLDATAQEYKTLDTRFPFDGIEPLRGELELKLAGGGSGLLGHLAAGQAQLVRAMLEPVRRLSRAFRAAGEAGTRWDGLKAFVIEVVSPIVEAIHAGHRQIVRFLDPIVNKYSHLFIRTFIDGIKGDIKKLAAKAAISMEFGTSGGLTPHWALVSRFLTDQSVTAEERQAIKSQVTIRSKEISLEQSQASDRAFFVNLHNSLEWAVGSALALEVNPVATVSASNERCRTFITTIRSRALDENVAAARAEEFWAWPTMFQPSLSTWNDIVNLVDWVSWSASWVMRVGAVKLGATGAGVPASIGLWALSDATSVAGSTFKLWMSMFGDLLGKEKYLVLVTVYPCTAYAGLFLNARLPDLELLDRAESLGGMVDDTLSYSSVEQGKRIAVGFWRWLDRMAKPIADLLSEAHKPDGWYR